MREKLQIRELGQTLSSVPKPCEEAAVRRIASHTAKSEEADSLARKGRHLPQLDSSISHDKLKINQSHIYKWEKPHLDTSISYDNLSKPCI